MVIHRNLRENVKGGFVSVFPESTIEDILSEDKTSTLQTPLPGPVERGMSS
jgi:hypothetical protein